MTHLTIALFIIGICILFFGLVLLANYLEQELRKDAARMLDSYGEAPPSLLPHWD